MAPREATVPFPDQYLTLDYEAAGGGVPIVAMPAHDPQPMGGGGGVAGNVGNVDTGDNEDDQDSFGEQNVAGQGEVGDGDGVGEAQDTVLHAQATPHPVDPLGNDPTSPAGSTIGPTPTSVFNPNGSSVSTGSTLTVPPVGPSAMNGTRRAGRRVDPLSIDPTNGTTSEDGAWTTNGENLNRRSRNVMQRGNSGAASHTGTVDSTLSPDSLPTPFPVSPFGSDVSGSMDVTAMPYSSRSQQQQSQQHPNVVSRANSTASNLSAASSTSSGSSAPLSTGSPFPPGSPVEFSPGRNAVGSVTLSSVASSLRSPTAGPIPISSSLLDGMSPVGGTPPLNRQSMSRTFSGVTRARSRGLSSVLNNSQSLLSSDEEDDDDETGSPDLDTTNVSDLTGAHLQEDCEDNADDGSVGKCPSEDLFGVNEGVNATAGTAVVTDEDASSSASSSNSSSSQASPIYDVSGHRPQSSAQSPTSTSSSGSMRMLRPGATFDLSGGADLNPHNTSTPRSAYSTLSVQHQSSHQTQAPSTPSAVTPAPNSQVPPSSPLTLSFGPNTTVSDLKYFAERGCIVALLAALRTPRLKTQGTRMLADYAKMPNRRVAVASNRRILEFVSRTMVECPPSPPMLGSSQEEEEESRNMRAEMGQDWLGREYAVETVRSLTATEESDGYLMNCPGLLRTLALVARGGPFVQGDGTQIFPYRRHSECNDPARRGIVGLASGKARLHACIAVMNLSCGKSNKIEIASVPEVLEAMRDVMVGANFPTRDPLDTSSSTSAEEARLKAATCVKNLSNADANDAALLGTPGLVEALGRVAEATCHPATGATNCTTNACLALMNLSISKGNKHRVFRTPGVMDALMAVVTRTSPSPDSHDISEGANAEARVKACSALSNLAIGYDNKIPMFAYPGFVDSILHVIRTDDGEARTKACSILWSFAAEMKNQVPVVQRGDILPTLVRVAEEDGTTEARFKCVAALTLLAESLENAIPLLESGALAPLMDILHDAGPDPTQWKGQTASWCVGFLMNMAQSDEAVPALREAGVVELLAPLLTLDHYQSLKAAMAVTFVCRYDEGDETYDLLRKTENVIPKIVGLLHNTLSGRGGNGYKYGVFTLRSSVGCIASLASGPDFMKERIATGPVFESLLRVISDFCVDGGTPGAIVGGGRDDALSATLAVRALQSLTAHLIPIPGSSALPFGPSMDDRLLTALVSLEICNNTDLKDETRHLASDAKVRIQQSEALTRNRNKSKDHRSHPFAAGAAVCAAVEHMTASSDDGTEDPYGNAASIVSSLASTCCGLPPLDDDENCLPLPATVRPPVLTYGIHSRASATLESASPDGSQGMEVIDMDDTSSNSSYCSGTDPSTSSEAVRTFLLADATTGRRFAVPIDPTGGRAFNDNRRWCYRRGRFCRPDEIPDPNFRWTEELQTAYVAALELQKHRGNPQSGSLSPEKVKSSGVAAIQGQQPQQQQQ